MWYYPPTTVVPLLFSWKSDAAYSEKSNEGSGDFKTDSLWQLLKLAKWTSFYVEYSLWSSKIWFLWIFPQCWTCVFFLFCFSGFFGQTAKLVKYVQGGWGVKVELRAAKADKFDLTFIKVQFALFTSKSYMLGESSQHFAQGEISLITLIFIVEGCSLTQKALLRGNKT